MSSKERGEGGEGGRGEVVHVLHSRAESFWGRDAHFALLSEGF